MHMHKTVATLVTIDHSMSIELLLIVVEAPIMVANWHRNCFVTCLTWIMQLHSMLCPHYRGQAGHCASGHCSGSSRCAPMVQQDWGFGSPRQQGGPEGVGSAATA